MQKQWRQAKRLARQALAVSDRQIKSEQIRQRVVAEPAFQNAGRIACYLKMLGEVDADGIIQAAWKSTKKVYLPVVTERHKALVFAPFTTDSDLTKDYLGMSIPNVSPTLFCSPQWLDVVIMPLVAFDKDRNRIGQGGGFYDRTFAFKSDVSNSEHGLLKPVLIGVAFDVQRVIGTITTRDWDVRPDIIITETSRY